MRALILVVIGLPACTLIDVFAILTWSGNIIW